jgi:hypothetical protein
MALVVGINTYVTAVEAGLYFASTPDVAVWTSLSLELKEAFLITATRYVDNRPWIGSVVSPTQTLSWPRTNANYYDDRLGIVVYTSTTTIPEKVKEAVLEQTLYNIKNKDVLEATGQTFESISIGTISLSDSNSRKTINATAPKTRKLLKGLERAGTDSKLWWRAW